MLLPDDKKQIMQRLRNAGVSDSIIGNAFDLSRQAVHVHLGPRDPSIPTLVLRKEKTTPPLPWFATDLDKTVPVALYAWRTRREMSQTNAAKVIGVDPNVWSTWERGSRTCSLPGVLLQLLAALDKIDGIEKE
jgi:hypothetical protein